MACEKLFELDMTAEWTAKAFRTLVMQKRCAADVYVVTEHNEGELLRVWALTEGPLHGGTCAVTVCPCADGLLAHLLQVTEAG